MDSEPKEDFKSFTPEQLRDLYLHDPHRFNELADEAIRQACVGKTTEQTLKLRRMQWSIDNQVRKGRTPLQKMQIMEAIFYGEVFSSDGHLHSLLAKWSDFVGALEKRNQNGITRPRLRLVKQHPPTA